MKARFEDILIVLIFALAVWGLSGCYHYSTQTAPGKTVFVDMVDPSTNSASVKDSLEVRAYEFIGTKKNGDVCSTFKHQYETHPEFCLGLQMDGWNNGCAIEKRKEQFGSDCPRNLWNTENLGIQWNRIESAKFTCFAAHKGKSDINAQGTASPRLVISHTDFVAVVKNVSRKDGYIGYMDLALEIQDMGGNTLIKKEGSWKLSELDEAELIQVSSRTKNAVLMCWPGILNQLPAGRLPR